MKKHFEFRWVVEQLFPLRYKSTYRANDDTHYMTWIMWFGKCFCVKDKVTPDEKGAV